MGPLGPGGTLGFGQKSSEYPLQYSYALPLRVVLVLIRTTYRVCVQHIENENAFRLHYSYAREKTSDVFCC